MSPAAHPRLIFGGSNIGDDYATPQDVTELLQRLKDAGIKELDTAARYPAIKFGASEQLLGEVGAAAQGFAVDTKILVLSADGNGSLEPAKIEESATKSYEALQMGGEKLNVLYCHAPDFQTPLEDQAATLDALHKKGTFDKVNFWPEPQILALFPTNRAKLGVSNWPEDMLDQFIAICDSKGYVKPTVYQGLYNLICRGHDSLFPALRKHGIVYNAYRYATTLVLLAPEEPTLTGPTAPLAEVSSRASSPPATSRALASARITSSRTTPSCNMTSRSCTMRSIRSTRYSSQPISRRLRRLCAGSPTTHHSARRTASFSGLASCSTLMKTLQE